MCAACPKSCRDTVVTEIHAGMGAEQCFPWIPRRLPSDTSFGVIGNVGAVIAQDGSAGPRYAILASPTPGAANSGPKQGLGPLVLE